MTNRNQKSGHSCQVCRFEEWGCILKTVDVCTKHFVRLCARSYERENLSKMVGKEIKEVTDCSWRAPNHSMSCWENAHSSCIPKGLLEEAKSHQVNQE
jgi:hypothetical protein